MIPCFMSCKLLKRLFFPLHQTIPSYLQTLLFPVASLVRFGNLYSSPRFEAVMPVSSRDTRAQN